MLKRLDFSSAFMKKTAFKMILMTDLKTGDIFKYLPICRKYADIVLN